MLIIDSKLFTEDDAFYNFFPSYQDFHTAFGNSGIKTMIFSSGILMVRNTKNKKVKPEIIYVGKKSHF